MILNLAAENITSGRIVIASVSAVTSLLRQLLANGTRINSQIFVNKTALKKVVDHAVDLRSHGMHCMKLLLLVAQRRFPGLSLQLVKLDRPSHDCSWYIKMVH